MMASAAVTYRRVRAPAEDGEVLIDPPSAQVGELLRANAAALNASIQIAGQPLARLRAQAREDLLAAALAYTRGYRDVPEPSGGDAPLFMGGHQPQLFHPGVWYKNFLLSRLAREQRGVAINLAIDNDVVKSASIRVPGGSATSPTVESISYDATFTELPFEERRIQDLELFASFGDRVEEMMGQLVADPLVKAFWPLVVARARATDKLGESMAQARHQLEGQWGAMTLEVPQSAVCGLTAFQEFAAHLLAELPRFVEVHNGTLADYRRVHRLRNAAHPIPDLVRQDDWLEAPFWIWDRDNPQRRRLFVRTTGDAQVELTDRAGWQERVSVQSGEGVADLLKRGIKLRTRALTTTLFARLLLADMFVHGIGGAKYDQITDVLLAEFYGVIPPGFMIATATLRLPIPRARATLADERRIDEQLRQLTFQPDRFVEQFSAECGDKSDSQQWLSQKREWIDAPVTLESSRTRCRAIRAANEHLQPCVAKLRESLLRERAAIHEAVRVEAVLGSREYAFCLHPESALRDLMQFY